MKVALLILQKGNWYGMATFRIAAKVTVSCWTVIEAETEEEAKQLAQRRELAEIHIDGTYPEEECWQIDADGVPFELRIDC